MPCAVGGMSERLLTTSGNALLRADRGRSVRNCVGATDALDATAVLLRGSAGLYGRERHYSRWRLSGRCGLECVHDRAPCGNHRGDGGESGDGEQDCECGGEQPGTGWVLDLA